jgi:hypothetical protein
MLLLSRKRQYSWPSKNHDDQNKEISLQKIMFDSKQITTSIVRHVSLKEAVIGLMHTCRTIRKATHDFLMDSQSAKIVTMARTLSAHQPVSEPFVSKTTPSCYPRVSVTTKHQFELLACVPHIRPFFNIVVSEYNLINIIPLTFFPSFINHLNTVQLQGIHGAQEVMKTLIPSFVHTIEIASVSFDSQHKQSFASIFEIITAKTLIIQKIVGLLHNNLQFFAHLTSVRHLHLSSPSSCGVITALPPNLVTLNLHIENISLCLRGASSHELEMICIHCLDVDEPSITWLLPDKYPSHFKMALRLSCASDFNASQLTRVLDGSLALNMDVRNKWPHTPIPDMSKFQCRKLSLPAFNIPSSALALYRNRAGFTYNCNYGTFSPSRVSIRVRDLCITAHVDAKNADNIEPYILSKLNFYIRRLQLNISGVEYTNTNNVSQLFLFLNWSFHACSTTYANVHTLVLTNAMANPRSVACLKTLRCLDVSVFMTCQGITINMPDIHSNENLHSLIVRANFPFLDINTPGFWQQSTHTPWSARVLDFFSTIQYMQFPEWIASHSWEKLTLHDMPFGCGNNLTSMTRKLVLMKVPAKGCFFHTPFLQSLEMTHDDDHWPFANLDLVHTLKISTNKQPFSIMKVIAPVKMPSLEKVYVPFYTRDVPLLLMARKNVTVVYF